MVSCGTRFLDTRCSIYSWTGPKAGLAALVWSSIPVTGAFIVLSLLLGSARLLVIKAIITWRSVPRPHSLSANSREIRKLSRAAAHMAFRD
jgi:hypothetical protein